MSDDSELQIKDTVAYGPRFRFPTIFLANQTVEERFEQVKALKCNPEDVLICSYPKSGTHWVGNLVTRLLRGVPYGGLEQVSPIEDATGVGLSKPSPKAIFSHLMPQWLPQEHLKSAGKVILVLRNPKDVAVSFFNHLIRAALLPPSTPWEAFFKMFMNGNISYGRFDDYVLGWDEAIGKIKDLNIIAVNYESILANGIEALQKLQGHLGTSHDKETLQKILDECSFGNLVEEAKKVVKFEVSQGMADQSGKFLLFRKGVANDWKNWFTVAQSEAFDDLFRDRLKESKLAEELGLLAV